jgi:predicted Zn-dependent peptidase
MQRSIQLILKEISKIKETRVDSNELRYAKEFTKGNLMIASESNDNQMVRMAQNETHFGRYIPMDEVINNVEAVTEDDILELADNLFQRNRFALTLLGPVTDKHIFDDILSV